MTYQVEGEVTATNQDTDKPDVTTTTSRLVLGTPTVWTRPSRSPSLTTCMTRQARATTTWWPTSSRSAIFSGLPQTTTPTPTVPPVSCVPTTTTMPRSARSRLRRIPVGHEHRARAQLRLRRCQERPHRYNELYTRLSATDGIVADESAMDVLPPWVVVAGTTTTPTPSPFTASYNLTDRVMYWVPNENYDDASA
ncbi:MAG: hypothetical protein ACLTXI_01295 [Collinsella sp.]